MYPAKPEYLKVHISGEAGIHNIYIRRSRNVSKSIFGKAESTDGQSILKLSISRTMRLMMLILVL